MAAPKIWDETYKTDSKRITIDPITRLEGHGKIEIFLDDDGNVSNAYWQTPELRGFEKFCIGRRVTEMNQLTARLCGVCPGAHHMAAGKAADACFNTKPTDTAFMIRDLFYNAHFVHSHTAHFYALAAPDFVLGPAADKSVRNVLGVVATVGLEIGAKVLRARSNAQKIQALLGGKATHPVLNVPGGVSQPVSKEKQKEIISLAETLVEHVKTTMAVFNSVVLENKEYVDIIANPDLFYQEVYYMSMVDENNKSNFYDGMNRVVDQKGNEFAKYHPRDYLDHIAEASEPWTYMKFPYLKNVGYKGVVDGPDSGIYSSVPLSRMNASEGFTTPIAQEEYERFYETFKSLGVEGPVHNVLANHWARIIEMTHAAERCLENASNPDLTTGDIKTWDISPGGRGVGCVEAPRGNLTHDYHCDEDGLVTSCNLIVGATNNNGPMNMSIRSAAMGLIKNYEVSPGLLNMVEMGFRAFDPCNSCATHSLPGEMPMDVVIRDADGNIFKTISRS